MNQEGARYLVVGGHAVAAHGYPRATQDIDLVVALDPDNAARAIRALQSLGYRPLVPVNALDFADPILRECWRTEKGALVFQMTTGNPLDLPVDLFIALPFDFETEHVAALRVELEDGTVATVVSRATLLAMKRAAARPKDLIDVAELEAE